MGFVSTNYSVRLVRIHRLFSGGNLRVTGVFPSNLFVGRTAPVREEI